jgi:cell wall-associated NlpC family hydrolase
MTTTAARRWTAVVSVLLLTLALSGFGYLLTRRAHGRVPAWTMRPAAPAPAPAPMSSTVPPGMVSFRRTGGPARTLALDSDGHQVASFTDGARTVVFTGPERTFTEPANTTTSLTTTAWVRLAPQEWHPGAETEPWFTQWFAVARTDTSPDVLAVATEYLQGSPELKDGKGIRYAGDASFGPESDTDPDGRAENSDFYDYLGIGWTFPSGTVRPKPSRYGDVDCSGYLRLVYGYRLGYPLRNVNTPGPGLPRRAFAISRYGPGVEVIVNRGAPPHDYGELQPGDLVFFNSDPGTGPFRTDHSGIFMGVDRGGHYRFLSSRSRANGPTFGDTGGGAILDGGGYWSQRLRNARRI